MCREFLVGDQPRQLFDYVVHRLLGNTTSLTAQVTVVLHRGTVTAHVSKVAQEAVEGLGPLAEEAQQQIEQ